MNVRNTLLFAIALPLLLSACEGIFPPENPVPAYLHVKPFQFSINNANQGSASTATPEVWVRVNGDFLGVYPLPAEIPVLETGEVEITLDPGIRENGIASTPDIYPFYKAFTTQATLVPGQTITINPSTAYKAEARFPLIEGFENSGHLFQVLVSGAETNRIQRISEAAFEGNASGLIELDSANSFVELATTTRYSGLLNRGAYVFLELNYKADVPVGFGVLATLRGGGSPRIQYIAGFNPSTEWKKIYFNLSPAISGSVLEDYQVILKAAIPLANGTPSRKNARIQLDNIKLVHF